MVALNDFILRLKVKIKTSGTAGKFNCIDFGYRFKVGASGSARL